MNYEKYIIIKGGEEIGVSWYDIERYILTPDAFKRFETFMAGQTCGCVDDSCKTSVVYTGDLERFLKGLANTEESLFIWQKGYK